MNERKQIINDLQLGTLLTQELPKLGVKDIFNHLANFSNLIIEKIAVFVKIAVHKCVFNVNEVGAEGAAGIVFGIFCEKCLKKWWFQIIRWLFELANNMTLLIKEL